MTDPEMLDVHARDIGIIQIAERLGLLKFDSPPEEH